MKKLFLHSLKTLTVLMWTAIIITAIGVFPVIVSAQVVGSTKTEEYKASFEKKVNIDSLMDYDGPKIPIQLQFLLNSVL